MARRAVPLAIAIAIAMPFAVVPLSAKGDDTSISTCVMRYEHAQVSMKHGALLVAREELAACLSPKCPAPLRSDCGRWFDEVSKRMPSVLVTCADDKGERDGSAGRSIDDRDIGPFDGRFIEIDPGSHVAHCRSKGRATKETFTIAEGERKDLRVRTSAALANLSPPPPTQQPQQQQPSTRSGDTTSESTRASWLAYAFLGVGVAAGATSAGFWITAEADRRRLETCKPFCDEHDVDVARTKYTVAQVTLGVSLVSLAAAALFFLHPSLRTKSTATADRLGVGVVF